MTSTQEKLPYLANPTRVETVLLPHFPYSLQRLKTEGYRSVGIDIIIGHLDSQIGEPVFLFEECKQTEKTYDGQLAHPKETMKQDGFWNIETFDEAISRCMRQELTVNIDNVPLYANPHRIMLETDTHVVKKGEVFNYKAFLFMFWDVNGLDWIPDEIDTEEVKGVRKVSLTEILTGNPSQFRECTQDIFTLLQENGYFDSNLQNGGNLQLKSSGQSNRANGFRNVDLTELAYAI